MNQPYQTPAIVRNQPVFHCPPQYGAMNAQQHMSSPPQQQQPFGMNPMMNGNGMNVSHGCYSQSTPHQNTTTFGTTPCFTTNQFTTPQNFQSTPTTMNQSFNMQPNMNQIPVDHRTYGYQQQNISQPQNQYYQQPLMNPNPHLTVQPPQTYNQPLMHQSTPIQPPALPSITEWFGENDMLKKCKDNQPTHQHFTNSNNHMQPPQDQRVIFNQGRGRSGSSASSNSKFSGNMSLNSSSGSSSTASQNCLSPNQLPNNNINTVAITTHPTHQRSLTLTSPSMIEQSISRSSGGVKGKSPHSRFHSTSSLPSLISSPQHQDEDMQESPVPQISSTTHAPPRSNSHKEVWSSIAAAQNTVSPSGKIKKSSKMKRSCSPLNPQAAEWVSMTSNTSNVTFVVSGSTPQPEPNNTSNGGIRLLGNEFVDFSKGEHEIQRKTRGEKVYKFKQITF